MTATHSLAYSNNTLVIGGVKEVKSFEETQVVIALEDNTLSIKGDGLVVTELDNKTNKVTITGTMVALIYANAPTKTSIIKKLFR